MSFIANYTADLRDDLRHGIDKSVGKTNLRIDDFLAKSHQQIAQDLTDPRHWYSFDPRHDLRTLLKGESPIHENVLSNSIPSGSDSHMKTNSVARSKGRGRYDYRHRSKQKREKRTSKKPSETPEYAMPCPTPEQVLEQSEVDSERSYTADPVNETPHDIRVITSAPPRHLNSAHEREKERILDNATVNSIQMREYLDGIISKVPLNTMDMGESFVLPTISSVRGDFLPTTVRSKYTQGKPDDCVLNIKKPLPTIDTTRIEDSTGETANPQVHEKHLAKSNSTSKSTKSSPMKGRVLLSNPNEESGAKIKVASSTLTSNNNQFIDNWITTLKTQTRDSKNIDAKIAPVKNQTYSTQRRAPETIKHTQYPPNVIHLKQPTIRIPNAMAVCSDKNQQRKKPLNPKLRKQALPPKDVVQPSDNLFKTHLATSELKLNIIQNEIDNLYNKDGILRKAVNRHPDGRFETDKRQKQDNTDDAKVQEGVETEPQHKGEEDIKEATEVSPDTACTPTSQPRAPSVISIEFSGDQALQTTKMGNEFPIRPVSSSYRGDDEKTMPRRVPKLSIQTSSMEGTKQGKDPIARVTSLEVFSERKYQAVPHRSPSVKRRHASDGKGSGSQHASPRNVNDVDITFDTEYDRYARGRGVRVNKLTSRGPRNSTMSVSRAQPNDKYGIQPVPTASYLREYSLSCQQDLVSCYSNLSGYFADLDSECSDQDEMDAL